MNLPEDSIDSIEDMFTKLVTEQIDKEIIADITALQLEKSGWIKVSSLSILPFEQKQWLSINAKGEYRHLNNVVMFESESDASYFVLTWK
jgi:hypothetical protein